MLPGLRISFIANSTGSDQAVPDEVGEDRARFGIVASFDVRIICPQVVE